MNKARNFFVFTFLLLGLAARTQAQAPAAHVQTTLPSPASAAKPYQVPGRTEPLESATIFTRATGIVQERKVDIGDMVKEGEVLAVISAPDVDRAVEAARAAVDQAEARHENARLLAERAKTLLASNALSIEDAQQRTAAAAEAEAAARAAKAQLARLEEQQRFSIVRAPFDGVVTARNFDRGDRVRGDAATADGWLFRLARLDTLRFTVAATPDLALRLNGNQPVNVAFAEFPGRNFPASLSRTSRVFEGSTGTMRIELTVDNKDLSIPAGLTGTASFQLSESRKVVLVPNNTLFTREGRSFVATVLDGKVEFVPVNLGRNLGAQVEVFSDALSTDTPVIVNPNALLRPGDLVQIAGVAKK